MSSSWVRDFLKEPIEIQDGIMARYVVPVALKEFGETRGHVGLSFKGRNTNRYVVRSTHPDDHRFQEIMYPPFAGVT
ncbi:MAG: hypothetical protein SV775_09840 [Thermodesulfobacteriota bacterium]|nr:hypothetical protein [Thermodesulfobacteriota bacterium]